MVSSSGSDESNYNSSWSSSPGKTMEEVWNDIIPASLPHQQKSPNNNNPNFRNMPLQDFLALPFANNANARLVVSPIPDHTARNFALPTNPMIPNPAPVLNLNDSCSDQFQLFCIENLNHRSIVNIPNTSSENSYGGTCPLFKGLGINNDTSSANPGLVMPPFGVNDKKRFPESDHIGGDRRFKRMIKNRESAARSRARKQAYTNELELENQQLMAENERLKKQQEQGKKFLQLSKAVEEAAAKITAAQLPRKVKKPTLERSTTAPF